MASLIAALLAVAEASTASDASAAPRGNDAAILADKSPQSSASAGFTVAAPPSAVGVAQTSISMRPSQPSSSSFLSSPAPAPSGRRLVGGADTLSAAQRRPRAHSLGSAQSPSGRSREPTVAAAALSLPPLAASSPSRRKASVTAASPQKQKGPISQATRRDGAPILLPPPRLLPLHRLQWETFVDHSERQGLEALEAEEAAARAAITDRHAEAYALFLLHRSRQLRRLYRQQVTLHCILTAVEEEGRVAVSRSEERCREPISHALCAARYGQQFLTQVLRRGAIIEDDLKRERKFTLRAEAEARHALIVADAHGRWSLEQRAAANIQRRNRRAQDFIVASKAFASFFPPSALGMGVGGGGEGAATSASGRPVNTSFTFGGELSDDESDNGGGGGGGDLSAFGFGSDHLDDFSFGKSDADAYADEGRDGYSSEDNDSGNQKEWRDGGDAAAAEGYEKGSAADSEGGGFSPSAFTHASRSPAKASRTHSSAHNKSTASTTTASPHAQARTHSQSVAAADVSKYVSRHIPPSRLRRHFASMGAIVAALTADPARYSQAAAERARTLSSIAKLSRRARELMALIDPTRGVGGGGGASSPPSGAASRSVYAEGGEGVPKEWGGSTYCVPTPDVNAVSYTSGFAATPDAARITVWAARARSCGNLSDDNNNSSTNQTASTPASTREAAAAALWTVHLALATADQLSGKADVTGSANDRTHDDGSLSTALRPYAHVLGAATSVNGGTSDEATSAPKEAEEESVLASLSSGPQCDAFVAAAEAALSAIGAGIRAKFDLPTPKPHNDATAAAIAAAHSFGGSPSSQSPGHSPSSSPAHFSLAESAHAAAAAAATSAADSSPLPLPSHVSRALAERVAFIVGAVGGSGAAAAANTNAHTSPEADAAMAAADNTNCSRLARRRLWQLRASAAEAHRMLFPEAASSHFSSGGAEALLATSTAGASTSPSSSNHLSLPAADISALRAALNAAVASEAQRIVSEDTSSSSSDGGGGVDGERKNGGSEVPSATVLALRAVDSLAAASASPHSPSRPSPSSSKKEGGERRNDNAFDDPPYCLFASDALATAQRRFSALSAAAGGIMNICLSTIDADSSNCASSSSSSSSASSTPASIPTGAAGYAALTLLATIVGECQRALSVASEAHAPQPSSRDGDWDGGEGKHRSRHHAAGGDDSFVIGRVRRDRNGAEPNDSFTSQASPPPPPLRPRTEEELAEYLQQQQNTDGRGFHHHQRQNASHGHTASASASAHSPSARELHAQRRAERRQCEAESLVGGAILSASASEAGDAVLVGAAAEAEGLALHGLWLLTALQSMAEVLLAIAARGPSSAAGLHEQQQQHSQVAPTEEHIPTANPLAAPNAFEFLASPAAFQRAAYFPTVAFYWSLCAHRIGSALLHGTLSGLLGALHTPIDLAFREEYPTRLQLLSSVRVRNHFAAAARARREAAAERRREAAHRLVNEAMLQRAAAVAVSTASSEGADDNAREGTGEVAGEGSASGDGGGTATHSPPPPPVDYSSAAAPLQQRPFHARLIGRIESSIEAGITAANATRTITIGPHSGAVAAAEEEKEKASHSPHLAPIGGPRPSSVGSNSIARTASASHHQQHSSDRPLRQQRSKSVFFPTAEEEEERAAAVLARPPRALFTVPSHAAAAGAMAPAYCGGGDGTAARHIGNGASVAVTNPTAVMLVAANFLWAGGTLPSSSGAAAAGAGASQQQRQQRGASAVTPQKGFGRPSSSSMRGEESPPPQGRQRSHRGGDAFADSGSGGDAAQRTASRGKSSPSSRHHSVHAKSLSGKDTTAPANASSPPSLLFFLQGFDSVPVRPCAANAKAAAGIGAQQQKHERRCSSSASPAAATRRRRGSSSGSKAGANTSSSPPPPAVSASSARYPHAYPSSVVFMHHQSTQTEGAIGDLIAGAKEDAVGDPYA